MKEHNEIIKSWEINAAEWSRIVEEEGITSRQYTNPAIIKAVEDYRPSKILDLGCGEGWLTRALTNNSQEVTGVDATEALLETARRKGPQNFFRITYEEIIDGVNIPKAPFDAVVLNFCLYQKDGVDDLLRVLKKSLLDPGFIFIQTLHPSFLLLKELPYEDQWIADSWKGIKGNFVRPHSWYARTFQNWITTFKNSKYELIKLIEVNDNSKIPVSIIFILSLPEVLHKKSSSQLREEPV